MTLVRKMMVLSLVVTFTAMPFARAFAADGGWERSPAATGSSKHHKKKKKKAHHKAKKPAHHSSHARKSHAPSAESSTHFPTQPGSTGMMENEKQAPLPPPAPTNQ